MTAGASIKGPTVCSRNKSRTRYRLSGLALIILAIHVLCLSVWGTVDCFGPSGEARGLGHLSPASGCCESISHVLYKQHSGILTEPGPRIKRATRDYRLPVPTDAK
jgi:hypothetical protein